MCPSATASASERNVFVGGLDSRFVFVSLFVWLVGWLVGWLVARHFFVRSFVGSSGLLVVRWCLLVLVRVRWCLSLFVVFSRSVIRLKPSEPSFGLFHPSLSVLSVQSQSHDVASSERRQNVRLLDRPSFVIVLSNDEDR